MRTESIPDNWDEKKKELVNRYPQLDEDDVVYHEGNDEQLISHLQEQLNKTRTEIKQIIKSL